MGHSGKFIYLAKEFLNDHGHDFDEPDIKVFSNKYDLNYEETQKLVMALNDLLTGEELKTNYTPKGQWVPDEESAQKVADLFGYPRKGSLVILKGNYQGDVWPGGSNTKIGFMRSIEYPNSLFSTTHKDHYTDKEGLKRVRNIEGKPHSMVENGEVRHTYERALVFEKLRNSSATEGFFSELDAEERLLADEYFLLKAEIKSVEEEIEELEREMGLYNPVKSHDVNPKADEKYFELQNKVIELSKYQEKLEEDLKMAKTNWDNWRKEKGLNSAEEAYAVIKTSAPYGAKAFTVVGDRATAARVAKIKNKTLEDDSKHTYIYRKMDEVNSEKYNIPVNEGVENMEGLVDKLLALGQETAPANEGYGDYASARPNSNRLLEQLDDYLDGKTLAEELINWMSDDEVGRFAEEYGYFSDPEEEDDDDVEEDEPNLSYKAQLAKKSQPDPLGDEPDEEDIEEEAEEACNEEMGSPLYSVTCLSWGDGMGLVTKSGVLDFMKKSGASEDEITYFEENIDGIGPGDVLNYGDFEVELEESSDKGSAMEDLTKKEEGIEIEAEESHTDESELDKESYPLNDSQKEFLWDELDMAEVYANDPDSKYSRFETAKEGEWRLDKNSDSDYPWTLFVGVDSWDAITDSLAKKVLGISSEKPVEDSQALDEKEGKPVKSATEKSSKCASENFEDEHLGLSRVEDYDETEREMFEAMNRSSLTDFQAAITDSISRVGSLGTIQLLLDSDLSDSFEDELFFIKNTYDLSDTQLVSQAILDAGETLLENWEIEEMIETLKNTSNGEEADEFDEYQEPEDWSEVDQIEGETVEKPAEGEEITEEETEIEEENI